MELEKHGLFATMDNVEDAMQYADEIIAGIPKKEQGWAYLAVYVLYNSVVKHYEEAKLKEGV